MILIEYLYGIKSERQLIKDMKFNGTDIFQQVFDELIFQAVSHGLVGGKILYTDSTHLKANASNKKFIVEEIEKSIKDYVSELDKAIDYVRKFLIENF